MYPNPLIFIHTASLTGNLIQTTTALSLGELFRCAVPVRLKAPPFLSVDIYNNFLIIFVAFEGARENVRKRFCLLVACSVKHHSQCFSDFEYLLTIYSFFQRPNKTIHSRRESARDVPGGLFNKQCANTNPLALSLTELPPQI